MCGMADARMAIDPITVGREAARAGLPVQATELSGGTGRSRTSTPASFYSRAVLAQVSQVGAEVQASAGSPRGAMTPLLEAAAEVLAAREGRWHPEPWNCAAPRNARELRTAIAARNPAELAVCVDRPREIEREASR